jgi:predicted acylesterase/phospholipase RssA
MAIGSYSEHWYPIGPNDGAATTKLNDKQKRISMKSNKINSLPVLACLCLLLAAGCATSPIQTTTIETFDPNEGYRLENLDLGENNSDELFVVLTFSGGGTRAASFAYGVLEVLRDTPIVWQGEERTLLEEVDIISSVSGGSLPSTYYGMFGDRIFEDFTEKVLYQDIQGGIIKSVLSPRMYASLLSPYYSRTDILARGFNQYIFDEKTYGDLLAKGTRPYIVVNATDTDLGSGFNFTQEQFDLIYSDLTQFKLGHAVAASACFPGAFPPIVLKNHQPGDDYELPTWVKSVSDKNQVGGAIYRAARGLRSYSEEERPYIHLMDGGVADNLGLIPGIRAVRFITAPTENRLRHLVEGVEKVVFIVVNSEQKAHEWDTTDTPAGLVKQLLFAGTAPMGNFTEAQLEYMQLLMEVSAYRAEKDPSLPNPEYHFIEVSFDYVPDPEKRRLVNETPTSFRLEVEQVDRLRSAAKEILDVHPEYEKLLDDLK